MSGARGGSPPGGGPPERDPRNGDPGSGGPAGRPDPAGRLGPEERAVIEEALADIAAEPPPRNWAVPGCLTMLPGFALLLVVPVVARGLELPAALATTLLLIGGALLVVGLGMYFAGGRLAEGRSRAAAEAALRTLEAWDAEAGAREEALRAATLLLTHAYALRAGYARPTFDPARARERIGALGPLVEAVEAYLVEGGHALHVFTPPPPAEDEEGADDPGGTGAG